MLIVSNILKNGANKRIIDREGGEMLVLLSSLTVERDETGLRSVTVSRTRGPL